MANHGLPDKDELAGLVANNMHARQRAAAGFEQPACQAVVILGDSGSDQAFMPGHSLHIRSAHGLRIPRGDAYHGDFRSLL